MNSVQLLQRLLALLRAQYALYQDAHWEVSGPNFYSNHLLFERLYKGVVDEIDTLAEKMVAMFGPTSVDPVTLSRLTTAWISRWAGESSLVERGLLAEEQFEDLVGAVYAKLDEVGELSMGMDDFLMASVNAHETHRYLLQQARP